MDSDFYTKYYTTVVLQYFFKNFSVQFKLNCWNCYVDDCCFNDMALSWKLHAQSCHWFAARQFIYLPVLGTVRMPNIH